ncbi:MAG: hypothetical protein IJV07_05550 [Alphaproteobacteria bacterium]|nr:hypothetical protein [Alphaproteobacteria bacterium]
MIRLKIASDSLKLMALIAMTLDHIDKILGFGGYLGCTIGRTAFPIFAYLLIQHFCVFHPVKKYLVRLTISGCLTSFVLLPFQPVGGNILLTFLLAVIFLSACEFICAKVSSIFWQAYLLIGLFLILLPFILVSDYSLLGFLFILSLYTYTRFPIRTNCAAVFLTGVLMNTNTLSAALITALTLLILLFGITVISGKRRLKWWVFYAYYPGHLFLLYLIRDVLQNI